MRSTAAADAGQAKREKILSVLTGGGNIAQACRETGISYSGFKYHCRTFPDWGARVELVVATNRALDRAHLPVDPDQARENEKRLSHAEFVGKWFPDRHELLSPQVRIANAIEELRPREVAMFLVWPEIGKTASLEDWTCRKLATDPGHRIRYVSEAQDLSKRVVGTCQRRFTDESEYGPFITRFGPFYEKGQERNGRPWTTEQITIARNPGTERDRNLVASSWTSSVYGSRIDTLVLDDLQSQRNYNQAEEIFRRIRGTFFNRGIELRTLIIGTRIGPGDFYERMLDAGLVTKQIILPAADHEGNPTCPEFWDRDVYHDGGPCCMGRRDPITGDQVVCPRDGTKLTPREFMALMRHQSGEETWHASYMQNPQAHERSTFAQYLEKCLDRERRYGPLTHVA